MQAYGRNQSLFEPRTGGVVSSESAIPPAGAGLQRDHTTQSGLKDFYAPVKALADTTLGAVLEEQGDQPKINEKAEDVV